VATKQPEKKADPVQHQTRKVKKNPPQEGTKIYTLRVRVEYQPLHLPKCENGSQDKKPRTYWSGKKNM